MKSITILFLLLSMSLFSQEGIDVTLSRNIDFKAETLVGIDNFETIYYINHSSFVKKSNNKTIDYSNVQLGDITSANAFNPLKINLFYKDFNTVIILDNRLAEIFRIDFNTKPSYKNVSHISTGFDNSLWLFDSDLQVLELYDYKTDKVRATTMPVTSIVLDITSNYNHCWLLTDEFLYTYNYTGSMISKIKNDGYTAIQQDNGNLVIQGDQGLYYLEKNTNELSEILLPKLLINQFLLTNETLYIYGYEILQQFQLKIK